MLISHEVPICLLNKSERFNDYDYCLLHLLLENEDYKKYYINASKKGRRILLDNSIFELGESLDSHLIIKGVKMINPEWVVAPDCLDNADKTIANFKKFVSKFKSSLPNNKSKIIGVVQGSTKEELKYCYEFMSEYADKIAFSFNCKGYNDYCPENSYYGRFLFILDLITSKLWNTKKPHHLLGCYRAKEFSLYEDISGIETIDTSNPIVCGIKNLKYGLYGYNDKPKEKLYELINIKLNKTQKRIINYNIKAFRRICNE